MQMSKYFRVINKHFLDKTRLYKTVKMSRVLSMNQITYFKISRIRNSLNSQSIKKQPNLDEKNFLK